MMLLSKPIEKVQRGCEKCGLDISLSIWKDKPIIIKPYTKSNACYCVRCGLNSTNRRIMLTENNLDEFLQSNGFLEIHQTPEFIESEFKVRTEIIKVRKKKHQPIIKNRMEVTI